MDGQLRVAPDHFPVFLQTVIKGTGEHLGIAAAWQMTFRPDGAFHGEVTAPPVSSQFGWNGVVGVASWERESGIVRPLVYDDHEVCSVYASCSHCAKGLVLQ